VTRLGLILPAWSVQSGGENVVKHASCVADLEAARFDATHLQGTDTYRLTGDRTNRKQQAVTASSVIVEL